VTGDERLVDYVRELFAAEDDVLAEIRVRSERSELPHISISPDEAKLIAVLLTAIGARRVLELGTLGGYSGVWIARTLSEAGRLVTIERNARHAQVAEEAFRSAGLRERVELLVGDALSILPTLAPPFDAVFLDADKAPLPTYFEHAVRLLRCGGLLMCDNTFMRGKIVDPSVDDADVSGMRVFNRRVAEDERLVGAVAPVRDGLLVAVKVRD